ncbi:MAG: DTW domain-containing protein [Myxococcota bacterium]|nr:DTW domain-containing protein [Myxococcota bacterium]
MPSLANRTRVLVLRHHHEEPRPSNTARIAALALQNIQLVEWVPRTPPDVEALLANLRPAWVLYPGEGNVDPSREKPATLVVLDATWKQARKMLHHHPQLLRLPRWGLPATGALRPRLRQSEDPRARSTLEAIADALTLLEGPEIGDPLHRLHDTLVQRVRRARGLPPP